MTASEYLTTNPRFKTALFACLDHITSKAGPVPPRPAEDYARPTTSIAHIFPSGTVTENETSESRSIFSGSTRN